MPPHTRPPPSPPAPLLPPFAPPSFPSIRLLGTLHEAGTGQPPSAPLTEHAALLGLLLALRGAAPSLRRRRFTFQGGGAAPTSAAPTSAAPTSAPTSTPPLSSAVFDEAPHPHALTDGPAAAAVLLPREAGCPTDAFAGSEELQVCGRAVWGGALRN